jgi:hypothetical protein
MNALKKDTAIESGSQATNQEEIPVGAAATYPPSTATAKKPDSSSPEGDKSEFGRKVWSDPVCVGLGYSVQFALAEALHLDCRWTPDVPKGSMARKILEIGLYRRARDQFALDISTPRGVTIFVVEA